MKSKDADKEREKERSKMLNKEVEVFWRDGTILKGTLIDWDNFYYMIQFEQSKDPLILQTIYVPRKDVREIKVK